VIFSKQIFGEKNFSPKIYDQKVIKSFCLTVKVCPGNRSVDQFLRFKVDMDAGS
jgi:hypothetical protein